FTLARPRVVSDLPAEVCSIAVALEQLAGERAAQRGVTRRADEYEFVLFPELEHAGSLGRHRDERCDDEPLRTPDRHRRSLRASKLTPMTSSPSMRWRAASPTLATFWNCAMGESPKKV